MRQTCLLLLLWWSLGLPGAWADVFSGSFVDARYGDLLLLSRAGEAVNLAADERLEIRLNGQPATLEDLPRGRSAFVDYDPLRGTARRLDVIAPELMTEPDPIWSVTAGLQPGESVPPRPLAAGERLYLELKAPAGGKGTFDVTGLAWDLPAREVAPGRYRTSFRVKPGMNVREAYVVARYRSGAIRLGPRLSLAATAPRILETGPNGIVQPEVSIFARYTSPGAWVEPDKVRLRIDETDVTGAAFRGEHLLIYQPKQPFTPGAHSAHLRVEDAAGNVTVQEWTFRVE